jgi:uncharacterized protein YabN with tetrapyrrole methylase and pyrophosphatase domain
MASIGPTPNSDLGEADRGKIEEVQGGDPPKTIPTTWKTKLGDLLFVAVNLARKLGVDPEIALQRANRKFETRFRKMERDGGRARGRKLSDLDLAAQDLLWDEAKKA